MLANELFGQVRQRSLRALQVRVSYSEERVEVRFKCDYVEMRLAARPRMVIASATSFHLPPKASHAVPL